MSWAKQPAREPFWMVLGMLVEQAAIAFFDLAWCATETDAIIRITQDIVALHNGD